MKILVVDASPKSRSEVVRSLSALTGIVVQGAVADVGDALLAVSAIPLDGVVAGPGLAEVNDLIGAAREKNMPAVVVYGQADQRDALLAAGASHVVDRTEQLEAAMAELTADPAPDPFALIGRLAAGVAHDINNYLAAGEVALSFVERAAQGHVADVRQLRASFDGIARLARSLTTYARGAHPAAEPVDLERLIRTVLDAFGRLIPEGVRVIVESGSDIPPVRGVCTELEQVVLNLLLNGCEALAWGGTLYLIVERGPAGHVRLVVSDTGIGMPPEVTATGALGPSSKRGVGLGLGIVRGVVSRHGGQVSVARAPGGGTAVTILLPT